MNRLKVTTRPRDHVEALLLYLRWVLWKWDQYYSPQSRPEFRQSGVAHSRECTFCYDYWENVVNLPQNVDLCLQEMSSLSRLGSHRCVLQIAQFFFVFFLHFNIPGVRTTAVFRSLVSFLRAVSPFTALSPVSCHRSSSRLPLSLPATQLHTWDLFECPPFIILSRHSIISTLSRQTFM